MIDTVETGFIPKDDFITCLTRRVGLEIVYTLFMNDAQIPDHVPETFKRFFWDVHFETLSPKEKPYFVINRLLDKGNLDAARWVVRQPPGLYDMMDVLSLR